MNEFAQESSSPPAADISALAEHLFRHEAGKLVSILTGIFGIERLQLAEDVVQEALIRALKTWPYYGIPENPAAWLTQTAKNLAFDVLRREKLFQEKQTDIIAFVERWPSATTEHEVSLEGEIRDDRLRLMFACCHPLIAQEDQTALALKTLCGFNPAEIARAFLTSEAAMEKRLVRARQKIRELKIPFAVPTGEEIAPRLDGVLQTIYLLFNEGYKASSGDRLVREDLCHEAIRLVTLLASHPLGNQPRVHALAALMLFNAARLATRTDSDGNLLRLKDQDRSRWDRSMIARGMFHLAQSAAGDAMTDYHLQAGIAACHCATPDYDATDWPQILSLYKALSAIDQSPVVALNRAVAVAQVHGARAGLQAVQEIRARKALDSYYLLYAVMGDLSSRLEDFDSAAEHFRKAMSLTDIKSEQAFLGARLRECEEKTLASSAR